MPMPYCTPEQVAVAVGGPARLLQLSDLAQTGQQDAAADAVVAQAISEACGEIDMAVGHRFKIPLPIVPEAISTKAASWAARVLRRFSYNGQPMQDDIDREEMDREWLEMVATGKLMIGLEPLPEAASFVNDKAGQRDSMKTVSRAKLKGFW